MVVRQTMTVVPRRLTSSNNFMISQEFCGSKLPVGSSANKIAGRLTFALAIATLCCSPPESSFGRIFSLRRESHKSRLMRLEIRKSVQGCRKIKFISAKEAWEKFQKEMYGDDKSVADTFNGVNPLENSASYEVYLTEVKAQNNNGCRYISNQ